MRTCSLEQSHVINQFISKVLTKRNNVLLKRFFYYKDKILQHFAILLKQRLYMTFFLGRTLLHENGIILSKWHQFLKYSYNDEIKCVLPSSTSKRMIN